MVDRGISADLMTASSMLRILPLDLFAVAE